MKVLIIGGGVAGLTLRRALQRNEIDCEVFERRSEYTTAGAGLTLWPNATAILRSIEVLDDVMDHAAHLTVGRIADVDGQVLADIETLPLLNRFGAPTIGVRRTELLRSLLGADTNDVHLAKSVIAVDQYPGGVRVRFSDGTEVTGDVVVATDGVRSATRTLTLGGAARYCGYTGIQGTVELSSAELNNGISLWWLGRGAQAGLIPVGQGWAYFFGTFNIDESEIADLDSARVEALNREHLWPAAVAGAMHRALDTAMVRTPIYDQPPVRTWVEGRVVLCGDSAHGLAPTFGQGACLAIESAMTLASCLKSASDVDAALRAYEKARIFRTRPIVRAARVAGSSLQAKSRPLQLVRNVGVRCVPASLQRRALTRLIEPGFGERFTN